MLMQRLFIIAPSLARLIRKERGGERVQEGYFPDQSQRRTFVQVEEAHSSLILEAGGDGGTEQQTDLPPAHAQNLLAVSQGQVEYVRTRLPIGSHEIQALYVVTPGPLNLVSVTVASEDEHNLHPLPWFGPEVSTEPAYQRRRLALDGAPTVPEIDFTNAALNSLLDLLEDRFTTWPTLGHTEEPDEPATDRLQSSGIPVPAREERADEIDDLGTEDTVIRELARALQPRRG
jgi:hypothetical protein